jgi:hypothetical protein
MNTIGQMRLRTYEVLYIADLPFWESNTEQLPRGSGWGQWYDTDTVVRILYSDDNIFPVTPWGPWTFSWASLALVCPVLTPDSRLPIQSCVPHWREEISLGYGTVNTLGVSECSPKVGSVSGILILIFLGNTSYDFQRSEKAIYIHEIGWTLLE